MIVQRFDKANYARKTFGLELGSSSYTGKFDIFGDEIIDSFFEINGFKPVNAISYKILNNETMKMDIAVEKGRCYLFKRRNQIFNVDILVAVYKNKICIIAEDTLLIPASFAVPLNLTRDSLKEYAKQIGLGEKTEQEILYNLFSYYFKTYASIADDVIEKFNIDNESSN